MPMCSWIVSLCATASAVAKPPSAHSDTYKIVHIYPHDSKAYTQGLIYVDGHLYESTGLVSLIDLIISQFIMLKLIKLLT